MFKRIIIPLLIAVLLFSGCTQQELTGSKIYKNSVKAFNSLDSVSVRMYSENVEEITDMMPPEDENGVFNPMSSGPNRISRSDIVKINFKSGKRISLSEMYYNGASEPTSSYYIDNVNKQYFSTNNGKWEQINSAVSKLHISSSEGYYYADITDKTIESSEIQKTDEGYTVNYSLKPEALKEYNDDVIRTNGIEYTIHNIRLILRTDDNFIPLFLECSYLRSYMQDTIIGSINVLDRYEFYDINNTDELSTP